MAPIQRRKSDHGETTLLGIHHIAAISSDLQANLDFYTSILGLRLVKITINFDDPRSYHIYYGDKRVLNHLK